MDLASIGGGNQTVPLRMNEHKTKKRKSPKSDNKHPNNDPSDHKWYAHQSKTQSSSSDDSDYIRRGQSLDRSLNKQSKNTLCFKRDRDAKTPEVRRDSSRYLPSNTETYLQDTMTSYSSYDTGSASRSSRSRNRFSEPLPTEVTHHSIRRPSDLPVQLTDYNPDNVDKQAKESAGRFQIGKRLLKGEIGIKSFNYYLLKEGLKTSKKNATQAKPHVDQQTPLKTAFGKGQGLSKSEENIYEEIYFVDRRYGRKAPTGQHQQQHHQQSTRTLYPDCELCNLECTNKNCDICLQAAAANEGGCGGENGGRPSSSGVIGNSYLARQGGIGVVVSRNQSTGILPPYAASGPGMLMSSSGGLENQSKAAKDAAAAAAAAEHSRQQHVLQYQSYNPNNPGVFKIETTPVAFTSDYNPIHHSIPNHQPQQQHHYVTHHQPEPPTSTSNTQFTKKPYKQEHGNVIHPTLIYQQSNSRYETSNNRTKSSSSSDSMHHNKYAKQPQSLVIRNNQPEFHLKYQTQQHPSHDVQSNHHHNALPQYHQHHQSTSYPANAPLSTTNHHDSTGPAKIYKTDSRTSIMSENMSVKSENSGNYRQGFYRRTHPSGAAATADMSDSSIGDSLFSYSAQRRYFGSAESCRFGYECRRCSYDGDKCSFSDNCRYECRNCDCSSSYFSSDFDDCANNPHQFSRQNSARMSASMLPNNKASTSSSGCRDPQYSNPYHQRHNTSPATGSISETMDLKTTRYAEDFIKHITNVKQNVIYQPADQPTPSETNPPIKRPLNISATSGGDIISLPRKTYFATTTTTTTTMAGSHPIISNPQTVPDYATVTTIKGTFQKPTTDTTNKLEKLFANRNDDDANAETKTKSLPLVKKSTMDTEYAQVRKVTKTTTGAIPKAIANPQLSSLPQTARCASGIRTSPKKSLMQCRPNNNSDQQKQQRPIAISTLKSKSSPILHKHNPSNPTTTSSKPSQQPRSTNTKLSVTTVDASTKESSSNRSQITNPPPTFRQTQSTITQHTKDRIKSPFNTRKALPALPVDPTPPSAAQTDNRGLPTAMPRTMFDKYPTKGDGAAVAISSSTINSIIAEKMRETTQSDNHSAPPTTTAGNNQHQQHQQFKDDAAAAPLPSISPAGLATSATLSDGVSSTHNMSHNTPDKTYIEYDEVRASQTIQQYKKDVNSDDGGGYDDVNNDDDGDDNGENDDDGDGDDVFLRLDQANTGSEPRTRRRRKKIKVSQL